MCHTLLDAMELVRGCIYFFEIQLVHHKIAPFKSEQFYPFSLYSQDCAAITTIWF